MSGITGSGQVVFAFLSEDQLNHGETGDGSDFVPGVRFDNFRRSGSTFGIATPSGNLWNSSSSTSNAQNTTEGTYGRLWLTDSASQPLSVGTPAGLGVPFAVRMDLQFVTPSNVSSDLPPGPLVTPSPFINFSVEGADSGGIGVGFTLGDTVTDSDAQTVNLTAAGISEGRTAWSHTTGLWYHVEVVCSTTLELRMWLVGDDRPASPMLSVGLSGADPFAGDLVFRIEQDNAGVATFDIPDFEVWMTDLDFVTCSEDDEGTSTCLFVDRFERSTSPFLADDADLASWAPTYSLGDADTGQRWFATLTKRELVSGGILTDVEPPEVTVIPSAMRFPLDAMTHAAQSTANLPALSHEVQHQSRNRTRMGGGFSYPLEMSVEVTSDQPMQAARLLGSNNTNNTFQSAYHDELQIYVGGNFMAVSHVFVNFGSGNAWQYAITTNGVPKFAFTPTAHFYLKAKFQNSSQAYIKAWNAGVSEPAYSGPYTWVTNGSSDPDGLDIVVFVDRQMTSNATANAQVNNLPQAMSIPSGNLYIENISLGPVDSGCIFCPDSVSVEPSEDNPATYAPVVTGSGSYSGD